MLDFKGRIPTQGEEIHIEWKDLGYKEYIVSEVIWNGGPGSREGDYTARPSIRLQNLE